VYPRTGTKKGPGALVGAGTRCLPSSAEVNANLRYGGEWAYAIGTWWAATSVRFPPKVGITCAPLCGISPDRRRTPAKRRRLLRGIAAIHQVIAAGHE
jgi:hypothetical protein